MAENAKWYVVHTYSGYENTVAASIMKAAENRQMQDLIQEVNIPLETVVEHTDGGDKEVERKVFPGYVLVKMVLTDESWHLVRNSARLPPASSAPTENPIPLTEQEILRSRCGTHERFPWALSLAIPSRSSTARWKASSARWTRSSPTGNSVRLIVSMFGRETPIDLELDQVEPVKEE